MGPACAGCQDLNNFINPADPSHAALFQQGQSFRQPAQPAQPAFQPQQQQQFFRQQQQSQQQPSAEELAHQRLAQSQIQEAVRLQNCLANPGTSVVKSHIL